MDMKEGRETAVIGKQRLEAFSDGVLAVAVTLLVLDLHADPASPDSLAAQLRQEWPSFVAYLVSFFIVGVIWINHHALFALVARVDRLLMFYNLLLLLFVTTIPFTTSTLAGYLLVGGPDSRLAVVMYGASMEGMAISFTLILWHLIRRGLLLRPVSPADGRKAVRRFGLGSVLYPLIMIVGLLSPAAMLILYSALTTFYIAEQTPILPDTPDQSPLREQ
jgi:uncharacterized membrane protein